MSEKFDLIAQFDAVIVEPIEEEETYGNIVVPDLGQEINKKGTVLAVGPGKYTIMGKFIDTSIEVGSIVILPTGGAFTKLHHRGKEYLIGNETSILAIINKEE